MDFKNLTQTQKNNYLIASIINNDGLTNYWKSIGAILEVESKEFMYLLKQIVTRDMDKEKVKNIISESISKLKNSPLIFAVENDDKDLAEKLISISDINHKNNSGKTALMIASEQCNLEVVAKLLMEKADTNIKDNNGETAIMYAVKAANSNYMQEVLNCTSPCAIDSKTINISMLHSKIAIKYKEIINLLILSGANTLTKNNAGLSVLDMLSPMDGEYDISNLFKNEK
jgi:ankyrin repeat protein